MTGEEPLEPMEQGAQPGRTAAILSLVRLARVPRGGTDLSLLDVALSQLMRIKRCCIHRQFGCSPVFGDWLISPSVAQKGMGPTEILSTGG